MNQPPLIAHVIYKMGMGGLENGLINIINKMPNDAFRHVIVSMTECTSFSERLNKKVEIYSLHKKEGKDLWVYLRLWKLFRKLKPDIVHTRNLSALEAQLPAVLAGIPIRIHGEHGRDVHDLDGSNKRYQLIRKVFRLIIDRYIPLSQEIATYLVDKININPTKMIKICNGVDIDKFNLDRNTNLITIKDAPHHFFEKNSLIFGTVGRLAAVKNQTLLLKAFVQLYKANPDANIKLMIVGEGELKKDMLEIIQREGINHLIWLAGARNNINELMNRMNVFVLPSLAEGISNTILEAMASSLPIIATDVGGNSELVVHDETGYIVPVDDIGALENSMQRYLDEPELIEKQGMLSRERIEKNFSLTHMMENYLQTYQLLIKEKIK